MQIGQLETARAKVDESVASENRTHLHTLLQRLEGANLGPIRPYMGKFKITPTDGGLLVQGETNHPGAGFQINSTAERVVLMGIKSPVFIQECARRADGHINPTNIVIGQATRRFEELIGKFKPKKIDLAQGPDLQTTLNYFILGDGQVPLAKYYLGGGPHLKIIYDKEAEEIGHHGPYPITLEGYSKAFLDMQPSRVILAAYVLNEIDRQLAYLKPKNLKS